MSPLAFMLIVATAVLLAFYVFRVSGYSREEVQGAAGKALEPEGRILPATGAGGVFGAALVLGFFVWGTETMEFLPEGESVDVKKSIAAGELGGGTVVLTGLGRGLEAAGLMNPSAPDQVVVRAEELGLVGGLSFYALAHKDRGIPS